MTSSHDVIAIQIKSYDKTYIYIYVFHKFTKNSINAYMQILHFMLKSCKRLCSVSPRRWFKIKSQNSILLKTILSKSVCVKGLKGAAQHHFCLIQYKATNVWEQKEVYENVSSWCISVWLQSSQKVALHNLNSLSFTNLFEKVS